MLLRRIRHGQILLLLCASCHLTMAFPTQTPPAYDEEQHLRVSIPSSGQIFAPLGSSITIPCLVSLSSIPSSSSAPPVVPRVKWSVISGRVEKQILVARGKRVKVSEAYRDRAALLNYTSFPDDMSLWLGDLRSSDSAHYRCEVQQGLEDASDLVQLKVKGVVFHYRDALGRYAFSFHQAQRACEAIGAQIATADQLLAAYYDGYEQCDAGWLTDQSVRYPIQVPREGCYGDMDGQPGVRNYGTMNPDDLFDVYCYVEQIDGEVFHDSIPQHLSFDEAQSYCRAARAELATTAQLYLAWSEGLDHCSPGWLSDGSVRYPIITPRERCGGPQAGVKTLYRFSNQTGFPEPSSLHDVYCFKENRNTSTDSPMDYMGKEPEDVGHNFIILMEKDQEIQLNQQVEQVEREAQSVLESLPFFSRPFTEENLVDTQPTVVSSTTESPLTTMSTLHDPFDKTLSTTKMSYNSQDPTAMVNSNFTETYNSPQNTSFLPNDTDSHQNLSFTFHQSELIRTTFEPETQNQTEPYTNTEEKTEPSEKLKDTKETQETNLNFNKSETSFSETDSNYTQETSFLEVTTSTPGPMVQVKVEKTGAESPVQIFLTTEASKEEGKLFTELAQITQSTMEALTSLWAHSDGSGDSSQEGSLDTGPVSFISTSDSSISGFTTRPSLTASASSTPPEPPTTASHLTPLSQSRLSDKLGLDIPSTESQLWESSISKQEGSTSLEIEDTLSMENEEKMVPTTKAEDLQESGVSSAITQSPEGSNTSRSPTSSSIAQYQTSGYRVYLDSVTSAYEEASGHELDTVIGTLREVIKFAPTPDSEVTQNLKEMANNSFSLEKEIKIAPTFALDKESNISFNLEEENNVSPTLVFEKANISSASESVAPTLWFEDKGNVSLTLEDEVDVPPTVTLDKDINEPYISPNVNFEENANASSAHERNVVPTFVYEEKANISVTLEEEIDVSPIAVLEEEVNITSTSEEQTSVAPTLEKEANLSPNISSEEKTNTSSTLEGETQIIVTEEETSVSSTQEEEANVSPTLLFEEEAKVIPTHVFEKQATVSSAQHTYVSPTLEEKTDADQSFEDFTIFPLNSQTSKWDLLTTTTGPQESLNDLEYSRKPSSTAASASSHATKPTKTTTVSTTTHWSRRTWSPTTTAPKVFHEPKKVTHFIPPVDHSLGDVEISLTQPPTLLILPNERAAVGSRGKSSDSCLNDPCLNGGTCTDRGGQIECLCLPTYGGDFCQTDLERCEPGWDKFHGFCYRHFSQRLSWEVAEQQCRMMGAHLVSIMTPEEQSYINSNYKEYQWTGLNDKTVEDDFRWSDGNPLLYENWYRGQPDSYFLSGEDCVVMVWHDNGRWSDVPCNYHLAYTCKKGTSSCGPPPKVRNASIYGKARQRYETNAVVRYHCAEGFQQRLNPLIRCLSGGFWERPQILCMHEAGGPLSLTDSNFAAAEDDFEATDETPQYWDIKF